MVTAEATPRDLVYTPPEVARFTLEELDRRRHDDGAGVRVGLGNVDAKVNPLRPGELVTIIGRPSHYKSGFVQWWARKLALDTLETERRDAVVYGTCEMAIEELGLYDLAVQAALDAADVAAGAITDAQWETVQAAGMKRAALPLWLLGHSLARRRKRVRMSIWHIEQALLWIEDHMQFHARIVFLDYLNLMESDRKLGQMPSRRVDVSETVQCAKDLALTMGCPVVLLAQAHRRVDDRDWKLPEMRDAMEASAIEQYSDKMLSVWMPKVTDAGRTITTPGGDAITVTDNLLFLGLLKQKNGPAGGYFTLHVDPARNEIAAVDTHAAPPPRSHPRQDRWGQELPG